MTLCKKVTTGVGWQRRQIYRWCGENIFTEIYTDHGDTGSKFASDVVDTGNNLLMVHVNNASGKFATGAMTQRSTVATISDFHHKLNI